MVYKDYLEIFLDLGQNFLINKIFPTPQGKIYIVSKTI